MELTYHRKGDYLFPNLVLEEENVKLPMPFALSLYLALGISLSAFATILPSVHLLPVQSLPNEHHNCKEAKRRLFCRRQE